MLLFKKKALSILRDKEEILKKGAKILLEREKIESEDIEKLMNNK